MIESLFSEIMSYANNNQFAEGALLLWLLGVVTYLARNVPMAIFNFIKRNIVTTLSFNNGGFANREKMYKFMSWAKPRMRYNLSRTLSIENDDFSDGSTLGFGYGIHFFFYNGRLFWLYKNKLDSSGSEHQKDEILLTTFGRSHEPFEKILSEFMPEPMNKIYSYSLEDDGYWSKNNVINKRSIDSIAMDEDFKKNIFDNINHFKSNREWFDNVGLPYKLTYLLHGKPGGGKTSLIKAIASEYEMNICVLNINAVTDRTIERAFALAPKNSIILIEDFDSSNASKNRDDDNVDQKKGFLSITGILNSLDGINSLDDVIIFLTTNHLDHIDSAIYRSGRVDYILEIEELNPDVIRNYVQNLYPDFDINKYEFKSGMGCKLNQALLIGKENPKKFMETLIENGMAKLLDSDEEKDHNYDGKYLGDR